MMGNKLVDTKKDNFWAILLSIGGGLFLFSIYFYFSLTYRFIVLLIISLIVILGGLYEAYLKYWKNIDIYEQGILVKSPFEERRIMFSELAAVCYKIYDRYESGEYYCTMYELKFLPKVDKSFSFIFIGKRNDDTIADMIYRIKQINPTVELINEVTTNTLTIK